MKGHLLLAVLLILGPHVPAQDWSQWRGPNRDGIAHSVSLPDVWPEELKLQWKVEVGEGHSSPIVDGERLYIHTRQGNSELVSCLHRSDGRVLWTSKAHAVPYQMNSAARGHGKGPKSTPLLSDDQLITVSITGVVSSLNARTGELNWRREFGSEFEKTSPLYGTATSPVIGGRRLYVHIGGHDSGALKALDLATGADIWTWRGDGPGYASPILVKVDGVEQVVTQTQEKIVGVESSQGTLLWEIPFETPWTQNIVTPIQFRDLLIFSGLQNETFAVRLNRQSTEWSPDVVWRTSQHSMYMSSPVLSGDSLYGMAHQRSGEFFCMDAGTGEIRWVSEGRRGENAAIVRAGSTLFFLTDEAQMDVVRDNSNEYEALARYSVADSPTWAHPAICDSQVFVKDQTSITAWTWD